MKALIVVVALALVAGVGLAQEVNRTIHWDNPTEVSKAWDESTGDRSLPLETAAEKEKGDTVCQEAYGPEAEAFSFSVKTSRYHCKTKRITEQVAKIVCDSLDMKLVSVRPEENILVCGLTEGKQS